MKFANLIVQDCDTGIKVSITETARERMRGLLGRDRLLSSEALLLRPCRSIHTFGMRFAIDVIFLDRHNRIVAIHHDISKRRMLLSLRATQTLEMTAGSARQLRMVVGEQLVLESLL
ncbi:DUF192 domain-containing protein [Paraburkholderia sp.]|uniref:DUF192 domain-containing protein n=1 Tax=Paraburkholderia sp. TaxID=1926495 RepID=UPI002381E41A|nr:DUF192 domain-containing protein [Paraburkholderia sp.]MDE1182023.1 DUF192 domain-containing protein [Paraburkholderia sp.]